MRQKRAKAYRKLMALYSMSFGFRQPYQVLVDSEMCQLAADSKTELGKQISTALQGETKPMITQCCIHELYLRGKSHQPAVDLAKLFERRKCNHREPIPGDECLASVVGGTNKHRYVVATQSQTLRSQLRSIPGVPILHINRSVMILEPPSDATLRSKALTEEKALHATGSEKPQSDAGPVPKKRKGPKGPNPLSVKKKKPDPKPAATTKPRSSETAIVGEKRKREDVKEAQESQAEPEMKKKRKRRRKATDTDASVTQSVD